MWLNLMMIFLGHSRAKMGEKSTKIGHSGHFWGMKRAKNGQKWVIFEVGSLAERSNPGPKKSSPQKFKSSQKWINSSPIGEIFGVQSGPILALWWPERAFAEVKNAENFRAQGGAAPLEIPPVGNGGRPPRPAEKSDPLSNRNLIKSSRKEFNSSRK